jgi:hypothetical protein
MNDQSAAHAAPAPAGLIQTRAIARSFQPSFFFWITVVMALFIFSGFGLTYWIPMATGSLAPLPPVVHLHGFFYFSWIVLLIVQSILINAKKVQVHRSLGTFGIAIGTGVLILGAFMTVLSVRLGGPDPSPTSNALSYLSVVAVLSFGALFFLAIGNTSKPENHKRLILFATINLLPPGINRLYMVSFGLMAPPLLATYLTMDALAIAMLVHDWRKHGKIGAAALTGAACVFGPQLLYPLIAQTAAFESFSAVVGGLGYYR